MLMQMSLEEMLEFAGVIRVECRVELGRLLLQRQESGANSVDLTEESVRYPLERLQRAEALVAHFESAISSARMSKLPSQCKHEHRSASNANHCIECGMVLPPKAPP